MVEVAGPLGEVDASCSRGWDRDGGRDTNVVEGRDTPGERWCQVDGYWLASGGVDELDA